MALMSFFAQMKLGLTVFIRSKRVLLLNRYHRFSRSEETSRFNHQGQSLKPLIVGALLIIGLSTEIGVAQTYHKQALNVSPSQSQEHSFQVEVLTKQSDVIWSFDFLPEGKVLFTERSGRLQVFDPLTKKAAVIEGTPTVFAQGQGGLLEVRVHPNFSKDPWIYLSYSEPTGKDKATTAIARARLVGKRLEGFQKIFSAIEPSSNEVHFGSRIEFDRKGHIFFSVGDRNVRENVQSLAFHNGKIMRLNEDGSVPKDNPFVAQPGVRPEIWSLGHRNPQGLAYRLQTGELWEAEFGPRGGDELNLIQRAGNYGWPVVTYGREYYGPKIGEGTEKAGMLQPVAHWVPSISPSGITFYEGKYFPRWKGNLFLANLSGQHLRRLVLTNGRVTHQESLLERSQARYRCLREGPDGALWFSTDDGQLGRLIPPTSHK